MHAHDVGGVEGVGVELTGVVVVMSLVDVVVSLLDVIEPLTGETSLDDEELWSLVGVLEVGEPMTGKLTEVVLPIVGRVVPLDTGALLGSLAAVRSGEVVSAGV